MKNLDTITQIFLTQLEEESAATRKMLSAIPNDKLDWQPHPKSMTIRRLATHLAELPGWVNITMNTDGLDISQPGGPAFNSSEEILDFFESENAKGKASLEKSTDEDLLTNWTMSYGDRVISVRPKQEVIRMSINQIIHHRAQLGVFLRLLDVPIPGSYGPSADDAGM